MQRVVLTISGTDRPGIIDEISQYILERGGSIEDSRMINLRGQVSMLLLIAADDANIARIRSDIQQLSSASRLCTELHEADEATPRPDSFPYRLSVSGPEQTGVVHRFSHLMRVLNINIEQFDIRGHPGQPREPRFTMEMILSIPRETPVTMLNEYICQISRELHMEYELRPL